MLLSRSAPYLRWYDPNKTLIGLNSLHPFGYGSPFANGGIDTVVMPDGRLQAWKARGGDFQRMAIDPEALLTADSGSNTITTELDARNAEIIAGAKRRSAFLGRVMLDMHFHGDAESVSTGWQYDDVFDGGTKAARLDFVFNRLGRAIQANRTLGLSPGECCLDMFNEPPYPGVVATATYISHMRAWWRTLRDVMPEHTIIVGGNTLNSVDGTPEGNVNGSGLKAMTASHFDLNTGFSIHGYESGVFTHQGLDGNIYQYMHGLTFPAANHPGGRSAAEAAFTAATVSEGNHDGITASSALNSVVTQTTWSSSLAEYFATYGSKSALAARLAVATTWLGGNNKRIFNTEFGVNYAGLDDSDATSVTAFVQATREIAQEAGINCVVIHEDHGSNFGVQDTSTPWALNSAIAAGLFP